MTFLVKEMAGSIKAERPESSDDMTSWSCSQHQKLWMRTELQDLGLWPGSPPLLPDCLLDEFRRQEPAMSKLLQGTFGQVFRSDHTRKVAQKSESEKSLETMYQGLAKGTATLEWKRQASTGWTGIAEDLKRLQEAYEFCGIHPANPTKQHLNHVPGEGAKVPNWIPVRGTSQQEGYHFHQAKWITGTRVSTELFQGMTGMARWNYQRLVDLKQPGVILPAVFDPELVAELNSASNRVTGQEKYPVLHSSHRDTGEKFGL
ncbi:hypothetical protein NHX12_026808, partial [Muraenolepis orangiensis]